MTKLRTLKNLMPLDMTNRELFTERLLRQEAIKWIKEDMEFIKGSYNEPAEIIIDRWIERFNITQEDLK